MAVRKDGQNGAKVKWLRYRTVYANGTGSTPASPANFQNWGCLVLTAIVIFM